MLDRRRFLAGSATAVAALAATSPAESQPVGGPLDTASFGLVPDAGHDQSAAFNALLAAADNAQIFLPPGDYVVSNIRLPARVHLTGVPGASRLVYGGGGFLLLAEDTQRLALEGIGIDGRGLPLEEGISGLVEARRVAALAITGCEITASTRTAIVCERTAGHIGNCAISGADDEAIYCVDAQSMRICDNRVADCGNGGILVHRREPGEDGTIVTGNRIERIAARNGGTGQHGNGINVYQAHNVLVANNHVSDCAFSAIRSNGGNNVQIVANQCLRSGETAIYSEFVFQGAVINSNVVDGAAIGISIANFDHGGRMAVCSGNVVRNLSLDAPYEDHAPGFGIGISVEAETAVTGNVVEGAPRYGMMLGWGEYLRNVTATGNVLRGCPIGMAVTVVEDTGPTLISDNIFSAVPDGAVIGFRWTEAVTGDLAASEAEALPQLRVERNMVGSG